MADHETTASFWPSEKNQFKPQGRKRWRVFRVGTSGGQCRYHPDDMRQVIDIIFDTVPRAEVWCGEAEARDEDRGERNENGMTVRCIEAIYDVLFRTKVLRRRKVSINEIKGGQVGSNYILIAAPRGSLGALVRAAKRINEEIAHCTEAEARKGRKKTSDART